MDNETHRIAADLAPDWLERWVAEGLAQVDAYLEKHAAFLSFLEGEGLAAAT